jgi:hypothetical protein
MKSYKKFIAFSFSFVFVFIFANNVYAVTPSLVINNTNGDYASLDVYGDANSPVALYYYNNGILQQRTLGSTSYSGNLNMTVSSASYGILPGSQVYVVVNGQQSQSITWQNTQTNNQSISLSQSNVNVNVGQSVTITAYNSASGVYASNNANSNIATVTVNGNSILVTGVSAGSTSFSVCSYSNSNTCSSVIVQVTGGVVYNGGPLSFTQTNVSSVFIPLKQSVTLSSNNSTGSLYVANNSNSKIAKVNSNSAFPYGCTSNYGYSTYTGLPCSVQTSVANNTIVISGLKVGNTMLSICSNNGSSCGNVQVTVFDPNVVYIRKVGR